MSKNFSCMLLILFFCLFFFSHPATTFAEQKKAYSTHILILKELLLAQSLPATNNQTLGIQTKQTKPKKSTIIETNFFINAINKYRDSHGLTAVQTNSQTCTFAALRAQEITTNFSHDGFNKRTQDHTIPYTSWSNATENIAMTSDYKNVVTLWANSSGHAANMRANTPYVCVRQYGNYFAYEGMKP